MSVAVSQEVKDHLRESAEWRLFGLLFEYPTPLWRQSLTALIPDLGGGALASLAQDALRYQTEGLHIALFGPSGSVPVREVAYQGGVQSGYLVSELAAYYAAFGYTPTAEEPPDHLAIELGFLAYLKMKHALALACGDPSQASVAADAAASFRKDHLAFMVEPIAQVLPTFAPDYLTEAGSVLLHRLGPAPRSSYPLSAPSMRDEDDEDITCGTGSGDSTLIPLLGPNAEG